ncbi:MAG: hypothetical protein HY825_04055 [Acidobacteria bacterium]|nr:hypothetical protein [Acidobacteriota bacterium]
MILKAGTRVAPDQANQSSRRGARPRNRLSFAHAVFVGLSINLLLGACDRAPGLRHPGNGLPLLAQNLPLIELNEPLLAHFRTARGVRVCEQTLLLSDASAVRYDTPHPIVSRTFAISIPVHVSKGECRISLGESALKVSPDAISIVQVDGRARNVQGIRVWEVNVHVTPAGSGATIYGADGRIEIVDLEVKAPAAISVECGEHTSAVLGPWSWIRGME